MNNQNQQPISQISALPRIGDLLKRTWQIYKGRFGTFLGIMIFPLIVSFLVIFLGTLPKIFGLAVLHYLFLIISFIVAIIVSFWAQVSLLFAIKDREEKIGIKESLRRGWHRIVSFIWISILIGFINMGGSLLFIIPGIIFAIWFSFATFVLISEDFRGMNALFRSKQWVSGNWGKVFWRFLVIGIILLIIYFCIAFPATFLVSENLSNIISSIVSLFLTPFAITYSFLIYEDLRKLKGSLSFEAPKRGTKIKYILIGIVGFLLIPGILASIVLVSLGGARDKAKDARIMADMSQIQVSAEMIYIDMNEDYSDVNCLNPELVSICNDIKSITGKEPTIYSSQKEYCVYTKLPTGNYYCKDSSWQYLKKAETSIFPGGKGYCDGMTFVCP